MLYKILIPIANILYRIAFKLRYKGVENIPKDGRLIISGNHNHALDPVTVAIFVKNRHINFLAKDEFFENRFLNWFFKKLYAVPVHRNGDDLVSLKHSIKCLKKDEIMGIFPEGTRNKSEDKTKMLPPKAGVTLLAIRTKAPILPVSISGEYKFRKKLCVNIGKPIYFDEYYDKKGLTSEDYINICMNEVYPKIYELRNEFNENNCGR